jgi:hypothetical protein
MILCEKAIGSSNVWKHFKHINYEGLRKSWMFTLLKRLSERICDPSFKTLADNLYKAKDNGFYVYSPPIKNFNVGAVNYILRYTGRPALAQSRITQYTGEYISFTYTPHASDEIVTETLHVFDFIKKLILHIPERNFKMIRYQGFYFKHKRKQYLQHDKRLGTFEYSRMLAVCGSWRKRILFHFNRDPLKCIYCGATLELIELFCDPRKIKFYFTIYNRWCDPYLERMNYCAKR